MPSVETRNRLLAALSAPNRERLLRDAQVMEMALRTQLYGNGDMPRYVYFLLSGVASVVFTSERGISVELNTIGNEGMVGWTFLLGPRPASTECMVQVSMHAYRIPIAVAQQEFDECEEFRTLVLEFGQQQSQQVNQIVACNRLHRADARFARWLLMVQDRVEGDTIRLTQEFLSTMLGTRRTTVVEVAGRMERALAIESRRGLVQITDRKKLESFACECYPRVKKMVDELYMDRQGECVAASL